MNRLAKFSWLAFIVGLTVIVLYYLRYPTIYHYRIDDFTVSYIIEDDGIYAQPWIDDLKFAGPLNSLWVKVDDKSFSMYYTDGVDIPTPWDAPSYALTKKIVEDQGSQFEFDISIFKSGKLSFEYDIAN